FRFELRKQHSVLRSDFNCRNAPSSERLSCLLPSRRRRDGGSMADNPPALEQHHCDVGANSVRIDRLKQTCTSNSKPSSRCCRRLIRRSVRRCLRGRSPDSRWPSSVERKSGENDQAKRRVLQVTPTNDLFFRGLAHCHVCSRIDAE